MARSIAMLLAMASATAYAQSFPSKVVRIVTAAAGGGNDFGARVIAPELAKRLGQQVIVDNRGGAAGAIAAVHVAKSAPDGHTLLLYSSSIWVVPLLRDGAPYDPVRDFASITLAATSPNLVVVHPSVPVKSVKELVALARARPGVFNYGSAPAGATTHIAAELFKSMTGVNFVRIVYKGDGPAVVALMAGEVDLMFATAGSSLPHVGSGRLRALAVTSKQPSPLAPGLPSVAQSGVPGYESVSVYGLFAPAKTPATVVARLNQEILQVLQLQEVKKRFLARAVETVGTTPQEFAATISADMVRIRKLVKDAGIRAD